LQQQYQFRTVRRTYYAFYIEQLTKRALLQELKWWEQKSYCIPVTTRVQSSTSELQLHYKSIVYTNNCISTGFLVHMPKHEMLKETY